VPLSQRVELIHQSDGLVAKVLELAFDRTLELPLAVIEQSQRRGPEQDQHDHQGQRHGVSLDVSTHPSELLANDTGAGIGPSEAARGNRGIIVVARAIAKGGEQPFCTGALHVSALHSTDFPGFRPRRLMAIVLSVVLQGPGQSTFYRTHHAATHVLVSKD
jgi:hypothetical protein